MRREGMVAMDWIPVCKITCPTQDDPPQVLFNDNILLVLRQLHIDPKELIRIFRDDEARRRRNRSDEIIFNAI